MENKIKIPNLNGKKILITGGLGFIGSNLAHKCVELGGEVSIYDNLDPHSGGNIYNVHGMMDSIQLFYYDILNFDQLSQALINVDIIFNCAASTSHPFSMREPLIDLDVNSRGVINLLEAIKRFNRDVKCVHVGTSTQLGKLRYQPADENHPEFPTDIYSANKMVSEKYTMIYALTYNLNATVVRFSNVFGPRASIHSPEFTFNNYFVGLALQGKSITVYKPGNQLRNILYVDDAVNALIAAALSEKTNKEILFAVGDHHYSVAQVAEETSKIIGGSVKYIDWPNERKAIDFGDAVISNKKIKDLIGWSPEIDLISGLKKTKEYFLSCIDNYLS